MTLHRPMYTSQSLGNEYIVAQQIQLNIEELLTENNVNLFISGHNHVYEQMCKIYKSQCHSTKGI